LPGGRNSISRTASQALFVVGKAKEELHLSKKQRSSSFRFIQFFVGQFPLLLAAIKTGSVFSLRFGVDGVAFFIFSSARLGQSELLLFLKLCPFCFVGASVSATVLFF
jgi:hypothetical protein